jgi:3-hydroxyisobutyrate dehydrogenase
VNLAGGAGQGQHTKMVNQIILAGNMAGTVEGLIYASKVGLDLHKTIETIALGAASSTALNVLGKRMVDGNFDPGFYVVHYIKDL